MLLLSGIGFIVLFILAVLYATSSKSKMRYEIQELIKRDESVCDYINTLKGWEIGTVPTDNAMSIVRGCVVSSDVITNNKVNPQFGEYYLTYKKRYPKKNELKALYDNLFYNKPIIIKEKNMSKMESSKIKNALRWVILLPASIAAAVIANVIGGIYMWINSGGYSWYTGSNIVGIVEICLFALQNILVGAAFVATGWYIAPRHKSVVKTIMATIIGVVSVLSLFFAISTAAAWYTYLGIGATLAGAIYTAKELQQDNNKE